MTNDLDKYFIDTLKTIEKGGILIQDSDWVSEPPRFFEDYLASGDYIIPVEFSEKQQEAAKLSLGDDPKKIFSPGRLISLIILVVGKGGGKDWWTSFIMDYVITVCLHLKNPNKFFIISGNLDFLNVSIKGSQGERVFFDYFKQRVKENKFYTENYVIYEDNRIYSKPERKHSKGIIKIVSNAVIFPKNIRCFSETSNNESWDGYNVVFFVLDEISGFMTEKKIMNGWAIFETANSSCISRRTKNWRGIGVVISYPRQEKNDIILDLYDQSKKEGFEHFYGLRCFAWHFKLSTLYSGEVFVFTNPRINRILKLPEDKKFGIKIPIEYKEDFDRKPEESLTKYCALPPRASGNWIEFPDRVIAAIDHTQEPMFLTEDYIREVINIETGITEQFLCKKIIACTEKDMDIRRKYRYVGWVDLGETYCDAVIVLARKETVLLEDETGKKYPLEICRIVDVVNWLPEPNISVDFENVEDFILNQIPKYINLKDLGKDRWESATLHNKAKKKGMTSIRYNLAEKHFGIAKYFFYLGAIRIFDEERFININVKEMTSLEQFLSLITGPRGPQLKNRGFKKDKADGVTGCINICLGDEWLKKNRPIVQKIDKLAKPFLLNTNPYNPKNVSIPRPQASPGVSKNDANENEVKLGKPLIV